jgi:hypothetical protein
MVRLAAARPDFTILVNWRHRSCARLGKSLTPRRLPHFSSPALAVVALDAKLKNGVTAIGETRWGVLHHVH